LGDLHVVLAGGAGAGLQPLVMVVDRDREHLFGALLADHVLVEDLLDLVRLRQLVAGALGAVLELFPDDVVAELDALVTNEYGRPRDELADLVLALPAKGAVEELTVVVAAAGIVAAHQIPSREATQPRKPCIAWGAPARQSAAAQLSRCTDGTCMTGLTLGERHAPRREDLGAIRPVFHPFRHPEAAPPGSRPASPAPDR